MHTFEVVIMQSMQTCMAVLVRTMNAIGPSAEERCEYSVPGT